MKKFKTLFIFLAVIFIVSGILFFAFSGSVFSQEDTPPSLQSPFKSEIGTSILSFIKFILEKIVLPIGAVVATVFLVYAGFLFVTAQGNEEKLKTAKRTFLWTVVGVLVLLGSVVIAEGIKNTICQIVDVPGLECQK